MAVAVEGFLKEAGLESWIERFRCAAELLSAKDRGGVWNLILLDIMMDGQNGIELAETLRKAGDETDLIFVTSSP